MYNVYEESNEYCKTNVVMFGAVCVVSRFCFGIVHAEICTELTVDFGHFMTNHTVVMVRI